MIGRGTVGALEAASVIRARWFPAALLLAAAVVGLFLVVTTRESAVIGFTGYGRVLAGVVQAALLFLPLLSVFATAQTVPAARQEGVLEWYLSHPVSRATCFHALFWPRVAAVVAPLVGAVVALGGVAAATGQPVPASLLLAFSVLLVGQALCFSAVGMWVGVGSRTPEQALLRGLVAWLAAAALVDFVLIGVLLRWQLAPELVFVLATLNPMQAGRVGMLATLDPELSALGPVGVWTVSTLGPAATTAWGLGWPFLVALLAFLAGRRAFLRGDVL